ncbi:glycosyltransferase family 2 protein [Aggregatilinea lenta]|uniref:glycosyltransferase family 2 protein n=1 Tax=Aggregatilinea lenta TaxID=913108 RepID=UPI000E5A9F41|nr:glycosyltransferase family 2 protein [Aggregatilinea lenta]
MPDPQSPTITVLMAVHNGAATLREALDGILAQTLADFEVVVVDDASTDATPELLRAAAEADPRVRIVRNAENLGLTRSLNRGWDLAQGRYIARMDADDVALPERFARQVALLDAQPEVGVCGTWIETIGDPAGDVWDFPADDAAIRSRLIFENVMPHSTVMFRRAAFDDAGLRYDPAFTAAQDYDLWVRAAPLVRFANVPEVLLHYRVHPAQIGSARRAEQRACAQRVRRAQIERLGLHPTEADLALHESLALWQVACGYGDLRRVSLWLAALQTANRVAGIYPEPAFTQILTDRWWRAYPRQSERGLGVCLALARSPFEWAEPELWAQRRRIALRDARAAIVVRIKDRLRPIKRMVLRG